MNVLHVINSYPPNAGGMATAVHSLASGLNATGHRTWVLTPRFSEEDGSDQNVLRLPLAAWQESVNNGFRISPGTKRYRCIKRFAPDLVHAHGPFLLGPVAMRLADELGSPLVHTHHTRLESCIGAYNQGLTPWLLEVLRPLTGSRLPCSRVFGAPSRPPMGSPLVVQLSLPRGPAGGGGCVRS